MFPSPPRLLAFIMPAETTFRHRPAGLPTSNPTAAGPRSGRFHGQPPGEA
jgi:hypothetical protein